MIKAYELNDLFLCWRVGFGVAVLYIGDGWIKKSFEVLSRIQMAEQSKAMH